jgi:integrase
VLPRLGGYPLRNLTPEVLARFRADLAAADVGDPTIRKLMSIVQGVLQRGVEWHRLTTNPARAVRKPAQKRMRRIEPPSPFAVERMRARLRQNGRLRDATLVCVSAYAGLRPGEALALEWQHMGERTILIEGAVALGTVKETKTRQTRSVRLLAPLRPTSPNGVLRAAGPMEGPVSSPGARVGLGRITTGETGGSAFTRQSPPRFSSTDHGRTTFGMRSARCSSQRG